MTIQAFVNETDMSQTHVTLTYKPSPRGNHTFINDINGEPWMFVIYVNCARWPGSWQEVSMNPYNWVTNTTTHNNVLQMYDLTGCPETGADGQYLKLSDPAEPRAEEATHTLGLH